MKRDEILPPDVTTPLRQEFERYLTEEVSSFCKIEKPAREKIFKIIFSRNEISQRNYIDYFKRLIKYMKNGTRVCPDDRAFMLSKGGNFVYYPTGLKERGDNYVTNQVLVLYFLANPEGMLYIYDFGYRQ